MIIVGHKRTKYGPGFYVNELVKRGRTTGKRALTPADPRFAYALGHKLANYPVPVPMNNGNMAMFVTYYVAALDWSGGQCDDD